MPWPVEAFGLLVFCCRTSLSERFVNANSIESPGALRGHDPFMRSACSADGAVRPMSPFWGWRLDFRLAARALLHEACSDSRLCKMFPPPVHRPESDA